MAVLTHQDTRIRQDTRIPQYPTICELKKIKIQGHGWDTCMIHWGHCQPKNSYSPIPNPILQVSHARSPQKNKLPTASQAAANGPPPPPPGLAAATVDAWTLPATATQLQQPLLPTAGNQVPNPGSLSNLFIFFSDFLPLSCCCSLNT